MTQQSSKFLSHDGTARLDGPALRRLRERAGLTQAKVAARLRAHGWDRSAMRISVLETGKCPVRDSCGGQDLAGEEQAAALAAVLGVARDELPELPREQETAAETV